MNFYLLALFIHILGVIMLFVAIGFEWTSLLRLQRAQTIAQVYEYTGLLTFQTFFLGAGVLLAILTGIYMTIIKWSWGTGWIDIALLIIVMDGILAARINLPGLKAIREAAQISETASSSGNISQQLEFMISQPVLCISVQIHAITSLGIVFLMSVKPELPGALIAFAASLLVSFIAAQLIRRGTPQTVPNI
ncbi:hypothetical protein EPA93_11445 [Ktedonosporobacter rubrisoli]|uniref:DUF2269 family protein n=1 Tax=Ktedonosporobacter rubrisoli TaxID=2509675 RepID=A0A4P6JN58_KTERU|nr:hypothetical protein [Ktedonosporobacter rubrisoli]QBD76583.1 hypothetical protein EPA93_11445 [Ktedonosporobacter rubrisoli]